MLWRNDQIRVDPVKVRIKGSVSIPLMWTGWKDKAMIVHVKRVLYTYRSPYDEGVMVAAPGSRWRQDLSCWCGRRKWPFVQPSWYYHWATDGRNDVDDISVQELNLSMGNYVSMGQMLIVSPPWSFLVNQFKMNKDNSSISASAVAEGHIMHNPDQRSQTFRNYFQKLYSSHTDPSDTDNDQCECVVAGAMWSVYLRLVPAASLCVLKCHWPGFKSNDLLIYLVLYSVSCSPLRLVPSF